MEVPGLLAVPEIGASENWHVTIGAVAASSLTEVASTFTLGGSTLLTVESNASAVRTHRLDQSKPSVGINVLSGDAIAVGSNIFSGTASDVGLDGIEGSGLVGVDISTDGGTTWAPAAGTLAWSFPLEISAETSTLSLQARSTDLCDFQTTVEQTFTVDSTPPTVTWTAPAFVRDMLITISGTAVDPVPDGSLVKSVEVQLDDASECLACCFRSATAAKRRSGLALDRDYTTGRRRNAYRAVTRHRPGGKCFTTEWQTMVVDTVAPKLVVTQLATELIMLQKPVAVQVLSGTAADGAGLPVVSVLVTDPLGFVTTQVLPVSETDGAWTYALKDPAPVVGISKLGESSINISVQPWANVSDYGPAQLELYQAIVEQFRASQIDIPFPQTDVRLVVDPTTVG